MGRAHRRDGIRPGSGAARVAAVGGGANGRALMGRRRPPRPDGRPSRSAVRSRPRQDPAAGRGGPPRPYSLPCVVDGEPVGMVAVPSEPPPLVARHARFRSDAGRRRDRAAHCRHVRRRARHFRAHAAEACDRCSKRRGPSAPDSATSARPRPAATKSRCWRSAFNEMAGGLEERSQALATADETRKPAAGRRLSRADDAARRDSRLRRDDGDARSASG